MINDLWMKSIMDGSQKYIYILDQNGNILECSNNVLTYLNKSKEDVISKNILDLIDFNKFYLEDGRELKKDNNPLYNIISHNFKTQQRIVVKYEERIYNLDILSLSEDDGKIKGISAIFSDVTKHKESSDKELKEKQKLELLNTELQCKCEVIDTLRAKEK